MVGVKTIKSVSKFTHLTIVRVPTIDNYVNVIERVFPKKTGKWRRGKRLIGCCIKNYF